MLFCACEVGLSVRCRGEPAAAQFMVKPAADGLIDVPPDEAIQMAW
jgi:hypothetical protein